MFATKARSSFSGTSRRSMESATRTAPRIETTMSPANSNTIPMTMPLRQSALPTQHLTQHGCATRHDNEWYSRYIEGPKWSKSIKIHRCFRQWAALKLNCLRAQFPSGRCATLLWGAGCLLVDEPTYVCQKLFVRPCAAHGRIATGIQVLRDVRRHGSAETIWAVWQR